MANLRSLRCLSETATEMLECYGRKANCGDNAWWMDHSDDAVLFSKFSWKYSTPKGRLPVGWRIMLSDRDGVDFCYEVDETAVCRVIYALTVGADIDIVRESLEDFRVKNDE